MKRKFIKFLYFFLWIFGIIGFVAFSKFVFCDCAFIIEQGYKPEIGFGMSLVLLPAFGLLAFGSCSEFFKMCISSGSPDDK